MRKMDTAPPVNEFIVSLALPDDSLVLYHVWCLGRNALPLSQNNQTGCMYAELNILLQLSFDADYPELAVDSTVLRS